MIETIKIVVPTLNTYLILPRLINSLKKQTWRNWNLLFVDGDSDKEHFQWLNNKCEAHSKLKIIKQKEKFKGIYGAMNQGYKTIKDNEWILFWGSDDWAIASDVLQKIVSKVNSYEDKFDLVICKGKYINNKTKKVTRLSNFFNNRFSIIMSRRIFRKMLFLGMTPPHQTTLFSKRAFKKLSSFSDDLKLASDLDYFLKFSMIKDISILVIEDELVNMSNNGISSQKNLLRLKEVLYSYKKSFGLLFLFPFISRYLRKVFVKILRKL
tara:strand:+ start:419 stop:1219 length:801 start_codon:yes stop_codon:yes gene_type:complete